MPGAELLPPWIAFLIILVPLLHLERWIHQHLYGIGWLLTQDKERATVLYYLILLPGVFVHEFVQWLLAGALGVKIGKIKVWPRPQTNGTLRFDFVKIKKDTGRLPAAIVELGPLVIGIGLVLYISQRVLDVQYLESALSTGDLNIASSEFGRLFSTPDFWLWLYLLFAIGNAIMPTPSEDQNWLAFLIGASIFSVVLLVLGFAGPGAITVLGTPIARLLNTLAAAFGTMLVLNLIAAGVLGISELALQQTTGRKARYNRPSRSSKLPKPEPGGETPLPDNLAPSRLADRKLPIPPPPDTSTRPAGRSTTRAVEAQSNIRPPFRESLSSANMNGNMDSSATAEETDKPRATTSAGAGSESATDELAQQTRNSSTDLDDLDDLEYVEVEDAP
jgi:hypothetical protein